MAISILLKVKVLPKGKYRNQMTAAGSGRFLSRVYESRLVRLLLFPPGINSDVSIG